MNLHSFQINLALAWLWILLGFVSGSVLGLRFHQENWFGGYSSFPRRLFRLGHISFFGLAIVNLLFYFTAKSLALNGPPLQVGSFGFALGGITMPICCFSIAFFPKLRPMFLVPVMSLIVAVVSTLWGIIKL